MIELAKAAVNAIEVTCTYFINGDTNGLVLLQLVPLIIDYINTSLSFRLMLLFLILWQTKSTLIYVNNDFRDNKFAFLLFPLLAIVINSSLNQLYLS